MRIPNERHQEQDWRVPRYARDFELEDVWATEVTGTARQFPDFVALFRAFDGRDQGGLTGMLFRLRMKLGEWFGWDDETNRLPIPGCEETSVRDRLPPEDRAPLTAADLEGGLAFRPVYVDERESCAEISNSTVHALLHLGWVPDGDEHRGHLAVYVKHRGWFGRAYMKAIAPFRYWIVYPAMLRRLARDWATRH